MRKKRRTKSADEPVKLYVFDFESYTKWLLWVQSFVEQPFEQLKQLSKNCIEAVKQEQFEEALGAWQRIVCSIYELKCSFEALVQQVVSQDWVCHPS